MNDVAAAAMNGFELVSSWFTPTVLFCVLNLTIGTIFITSKLKPQKKEPEQGENEARLVRVPSLLERVKSINFSRYRPDQPDPTHHAIPGEEQAIHHHESERENEEPHVTRSKSDKGSEARPVVSVLKKSASEKMEAGKGAVELDLRRPATVRERKAAEDEAVDEKADDFINRFRQQLKLQRMDSILRYKEMLNRGMGR